jgi:hypothetical protein
VTDIEMQSQTRESAYAIWEAEGRPEGRAVDHWLAAEATCRPPVQSRARRTGSSASDGGTAKRSARKTSTARKTKTTGARMPKAAP